MTSAEQMEVEVVDGLAAVFAGIDYDAVAAVQISAAGDLRSDGQQMAEERSMFGCGLRLRGDVLFGNNEQMSWGLRVNVGKTDTEVVLIGSVRWDFTFYDLAK